MTQNSLTPWQPGCGEGSCLFSLGRAGWRPNKMQTRLSFLLVALFFQVAAGVASAADAPKSKEQSVRDYVAAFNRQDIDTMLSMVTDEVVWLMVDADKVAVETEGKAKLRASLEGYFKSTPGVRSELEWVQATASRVAALERVKWEAASGPKSQASLSVYEFSGERISRVYYFPVEK